MGKNTSVIESGTIQTEPIFDTHRKIREIVEEYREINLEVSNITNTVKENWVGKGANEFESQYETLIKKIEDFGEALVEIYEALVEAEASYESADDTLRQGYVKAISS